jgi:2-methylisocitrate lyase-like PEP mutase family enzyme
MTSQSARAEAFRALHVRGAPLVLANVWDAGSAKAVSAAGAPALATSSWAVAAAQGFGDGEQVPLDFAMGNLARITAAVDVPVSVDLERGYGDTAQAAGETFAKALAAGAIGCNIEDSLADGALRDTAAQAARIGAMRAAAERAGTRAFLNARSDVFFQTSAELHDAAMVAAIVERARAYADAGADGLFAPGLADLALIARLVEASPLPVNIMVTGGAPGLADLAAAGVARISQGPAPYLAAMAAVNTVVESWAGPG